MKFKDFFLFLLMTLIPINLLAIIQYKYILDIPFMPIFFIVPTVAAIIFSLVGTYFKKVAKNAEKALWERKLETVQRMSSLGLFTSSIAHDFNNVIQALKISVFLIADDKNKDSKDKFIDQMNKSLDHGADLSQQILNFAKGDEQGKTIFPVAPLIKEVGEMIRSMATSKIKVDYSCENTNLMITASRSQIYQVLLNLSINALQELHKENHGEMHISCSSTNEKVILRITDTGPGLTQGIKSKDIFSAFYTTKGQDNSGIGLYVCQQVAASHQGEIKYLPNPLGGAIFEFSLPL